MRNRSENQITLVMIRHGATKANKECRYLGRTEEALTEDGIRELQDYQDRNRYPEVTRLFSSPMKRCVETARILYPNRQPVLIPEWVEMDFGAFEGKNYLELQGDERYQAWIDSNGMLPFPEGESREEFINRCVRGFRRMWEQMQGLHGIQQPEPQPSLSQTESPQSESQPEPQPMSGITLQSDHSPGKIPVVGMVVHGGTIMSLLSHYYGGEYFDYRVPNGGGYVCKLKCREDGPEIIAIEKL